MTAQPLGAGTIPIHPSDPQLFQHISTYDFHSDTDYQSGLSTILGHPETPATEAELAQNQDLVLQAQCFYLARKYGLPTIDVDGYKRWLVDQGSKPSAPVEAHNRTDGAKAQPQPVSPEAASAPPTSPFSRPSAPTPSTAASASTLPVQPHSQTLNTDNPITVANSTSPGPAPPYPTSFADIVDLITQNKPVPGIEEVPDTVLELGSSKRDNAVRRKKPWEKEEVEEVEEGEEGEEGAVEEHVDVEKRKETGEGVLKILQPGAVPDSGLVAKE
ncbi:hypothetical protein H2198_007748 [Neophaeococcomyces mojaviensis]|uniref:Uncharacterized protein n=1 Tax=Neophaeococcomyces mojaviensis TaxID=3383035 RepID=A0ACC2ZZD2_9EURO|nr:hypothetical protein H2198_007748 [Knufia sp. JES_112]